MRPSSTLFLLAAVGCVDPAPEAEPGTLEISPSSARVTVIDGEPVVQDFTVTLVSADGSRRDVTAEAALALDKQRIGTWHGATLELTGEVVGSTRVTATLDDVTASAPIVVYSRTSRFAPGVSRAMRAVFDAATDDTSCGPQIAYPNAGTVVPRSAGNFDVQWSDSRSNVFEIQLLTTYRDVRFYTRSTAQIAAADWVTITSENDRIDLNVSGVIDTAAQIACTSRQHVRVSDAPLLGALYLWNVELGLARRDVSAQDDATSAIYTPASTTLFKTQGLDIPMSCVGCALSHNGARMAVPSDELGWGAIYDFVDHTRMFPGAADEGRTWSTATFTPDDSRLVIAQDGRLRVMTDAGAYLTTLSTPEGVVSSDPAIAPDGQWLANIEGAVGDVSSSLVVRRFDGSFGPRTATIVAATEGVAVGFPAWSPDGKWLAYTRVDHAGTNDARHSLWVVPSDGSRAPVRISRNTSGLVTAHWNPFAQRSEGEDFFYVSYAIASGSAPTQIVVQAFFPATRTTAPAYRLPFQSAVLDQHVAGWAAAMVR